MSIAQVRGYAWALAIVGTVATTGAVIAQGRPSTTNMTCAQARATVTSAGGIVLGTGGFTFDRFVVSGAYCTPDEFTDPAWVPTRDNPQCMLGFRCEPKHGRFPVDR